MNYANAILDYIRPKRPTITDPNIVAKSAIIGMTAWVAIPIIITTIPWVPYIGMGYYAYTYSQKVNNTYSLYKWIRDLFY